MCASALSGCVVSVSVWLEVDVCISSVWVCGEVLVPSIIVCEFLVSMQKGVRLVLALGPGAVDGRVISTALLRVCLCRDSAGIFPLNC